MAKRSVKKTAATKTVVKGKSCREVEKYLQKEVGKIREEIIPRVKMLDERDKLQYESAKKIIVDAIDLLNAKAESTEKSVVKVEEEIDDIIEARNEYVENLNNSLKAFNEKIDKHIIDESGDFKRIFTQLDDISRNGTALARSIDDKLNHITVNGGTYPLSEAMRYIYDQHTQTHKKLDEVVALVEPIQSRRRWYRATKEMIQTNGVMHFIFTTRIGAIIGTILILLVVNTIAKDVFNVNFDLVSIVKWFLGLFKATA